MEATLRNRLSEGVKGVPMSSSDTRITLKTSETTNLRSQITIMATKIMPDEKPTFRKITSWIHILDITLGSAKPFSRHGDTLNLCQK